MKKIFTFLVAFLTTLSGAVWGIERGSLDAPFDINSYNDAVLIDLDDCTGEYYITTNGQVNTRGIKVGGSRDATNPANVKIYLINTKFDVGGSAIIVGNGSRDLIRFVNLELVLVGENEITSDGSAAAIKLRNGDNVKLTISEESTGSLNINMLGDEPINQVAIGERGEEGLLWQDALHDCGSLTINGGTITTNGYIGEFDSHAFRMKGNGIVVAQNIETSDVWDDNWQIESGIYYEKEEKGQNALNVVGNVTINSPIPDENIYIGTGNSLTLGEGDVLDESRVEIKGGTLNAYKVTYSKPDVTNATVGNTPANIYCGPNTPLSTEQVTATASTTGITYKFLGWTTATEGADQGTFVAVSPKNEVTDGIKDYPVFATFILTQYPLDIVTGTPLETGFEIVYPNEAKVTVADAASDPKLAAIGAKLADDAKGVDPDGNATITEDSETKTVTLTASYTDAINEEKTENVVLNLSITKDKVNISNGTLSFGTEGRSKVYDGQAANPTGWSIKISGRKEPITGGGLTLKFKVNQEDENYMKSNPVNQGTYYAYVVAGEDNSTYEGTSAAEAYTISARPMDVTITPLSAEDLRTATTGNVADLGVTYEPFNAETNRGLVAKPEQTPTISGKYTVTSTTGEDGGTSYTISFENLQLKDGTNFLAANYDPTFKYGDTEIKDGEGIVIEIGDITPGGDIDDGDNDDNNWEWDATLEGGAYGIVYDGKGHGVATVTVDGRPRQPDRITYSNEEGTLAEGVLPTDAGNYTAEVVVTVNEESKTGTFSLVIKERPLGIYFDLTGLGEEYIGRTMAASEFVDYREVPEEAISGLVEGEIPGEIKGTISIASEPNANGKYAVTFENIAPVENGAFTPLNYEEHYYLNNKPIDLEGEDGTFGDGDDNFEGIEIDDNTGSGSGITTKRYQLYLANKDYNVKDAKEDYAAEGLELFSRHNKKYTNAGGSFTVWYEKDGVANAGGYRIFWSNRANGEYKEVKFDTVSEYFQIRNVQSDVYVKIYAADGFPVGNEEISAADYRAYAQPNKIVVITPQPTDVQIISMAGAVVATDKVTGQREFANLTEGVYIVRMGETVVKLQVRK